jgi:hypothetical protein
MPLKICKQCSLEKENYPLILSKDKLKKYESSICLDCKKENRRSYLKNNKDKINKKTSEYRKNNPDKIKQYKKKYYQNNKEKVLAVVKNYSLNNSEKIKDYYNNYLENNKSKIYNRSKLYYLKNKDKIYSRQKQDYKNNPSIKIRKTLSSIIRAKLSKSDFQKNSFSIIKYLPYSIQDLRFHLENQFEEWMNWENYGTYKREIWDDNDTSTWTWQIDHIVPHSNFKYSSMQDKEFTECWSLTNLRPLSSKQNLLDGNRR